VFTADESDISDYQEMRDANFRKVNLDFGLNAHEEGKLAQLSPTSNALPSTVPPRTPVVEHKSSSPQLERSASNDVHTQSALSQPPQASVENDGHSEDGTVTPISPPLPGAGNVKAQPSTPSTIYVPAHESPKKYSPFPTLESIFKKVDDMFSNIDHVDPEWLKKRKARERLASLPTVLQEPEPATTNKNVMAKGSLGSGIDDCSNSTFVASSSAEAPVPVVSKPEPQVGLPEPGTALTEPEAAAEEPDSSTKTESQDNLHEPTTPESKHVHEIGTPFRTPASDKFKPTPTVSGTPLSSNSALTRNVCLFIFSLVQKFNSNSIE